MTINWKKTGIVLANIAIGVYLILAITAFNRPDELSDVCNEVKINIQESTVKGFLNTDEVKLLLQHAHLYPLGDLMSNVNVRRIEETLRQNPFVKTAECYKTQTGHIVIQLVQRQPVIRVKADNGDDYYIDEHGSIMASTMQASELVVATGHIQRSYARKSLTPIGLYLLEHPLWRSQVQQLNVLADGTVELVPRVGEHIVYLGTPTNLDRKFSRLEKFYRYGLSKAGWNKYSYISLEFDNQIVCKRKKLQTRDK